MGARAAHSRGVLDTIKSWFFAPCSDDKDSRSECDFGLCESHRMDDGRLTEEVLNRSASEKKFYQVYYDQPRPTSPIRAEIQRPMSKGKLLKGNRRAAGKHGDDGWLNKNFGAGKRKTRRPQISTPFDFQHTGSGAVSGFMTSAPDLPQSAPPVPSYTPLELSIDDPRNQISPLLPYFAQDDMAILPPPPSRSRSRDVFDDDDESATLAHSRSYSSLSFHIPRRPVGDAASVATASNFGDSPPRIPPRARTRPRAYTSPSVEAILERIASAIIERDMIQDEIRSIQERQSICLSRPGTAYGPPDPFPPVVPPTAPSFAERVSIDRPRTAPSTQTAFCPPPPPPPPMPDRAQSFDEPARKPQSTASGTSASATPKKAVPASALNSHPPHTSPKIIDNSVDMGVPLAPPLPLVLRPPLRKKKSFSRVADWLFPAGVEKEARAITPTSPLHKRDMSLDSVTNAPRNLTAEDGFYQTLPPSAMFSGPRRSYESDSASSVMRGGTGSVYSTDEEQAGVGTATATSTQWSPGSTPPEAARRQLGDKSVGAGMSVCRTGTFDSQEGGLQARQIVQGPRPTSVGVAF